MKVVVFDGDCAFCGAWVNVLLRLDQRQRLHFAASRGDYARKLLAEHSIPLSLTEKSVLFIDTQSHVWRERSRAVIGILKQLGGAYRLLAFLASVIPRVLRDPIYDFIARRRRRLLAGGDQCLVVAPNQRHRFLV